MLLNQMMKWSGEDIQDASEICVVEIEREKLKLFFDTCLKYMVSVTCQIIMLQNNQLQETGQPQNKETATNEWSIVLQDYTFVPHLMGGSGLISSKDTVSPGKQIHFSEEKLLKTVRKIEVKTQEMVTSFKTSRRVEDIQEWKDKP